MYASELYRRDILKFSWWMVQLPSCQVPQPQEITRQSFDVSDIDLYQTIKINTVVINSRNVVDNLAGLGFESILKRGGWKSDRRPGTIRVPL
jgi:hypothetical protein